MKSSLAVLSLLAGLSLSAAPSDAAPSAKGTKAPTPRRAKTHVIHQTGSLIPVRVDEAGRPVDSGCNRVIVFSASDISRSGRADLASFIGGTGVGRAN